MEKKTPDEATIRTFLRELLADLDGMSYRGKGYGPFPDWSIDGEAAVIEWPCLEIHLAKAHELGLLK